MDPKELAEILLAAPEHENGLFDVSMKPRVRAWSDPPKAVEILEVLDLCINGALASGVVIGLLRLGYQQACATEGVTHAQLLPLATWRGES